MVVFTKRHNHKRQMLCLCDLACHMGWDRSYGVTKSDNCLIVVVVVVVVVLVVPS